MGQFIYLLQEGWRNLLRERVAAFSSISAIGVAMSFVLSGAFIGRDLGRLLEQARSSHEMIVFFASSLTDSDAAVEAERIGLIPGIASVALVTKEEAAEIYRQEFNENLFEFVEENPLPTSCRVSLLPDTSGPLEVGPIIGRIREIGGVEDVRYHGELIALVEKYYEGFLTLTSVLAVIITIGAIVLISNTIHLTLYARRDLIRILALVGATNRFIRIPFLIEAGLEALLAMILAVGIAYAEVAAGNRFIVLFADYGITWHLPLVLSISGAVLLFALLGSWRTVSRFLP